MPLAESGSAGVLTSVFRKLSRVQTSSGLGVKSTVLQSVIQMRSKSKLRWKTFSCSPDRAGPPLTRRTRRSKVHQRDPIPGLATLCCYLAAQVNLSMMKRSSSSAVQK